MKRRRFLELTALSATALTSTTLAGCTGSAGSGGGSGTTTTTDDSGDHPTTVVPGCPDVTAVSQVYCPGDADGPISVTRSARTMPAENGTITITVENTSDGKIGLNPYAWGVYRLTDDGHWDRVDDDRAHIEPWQILESGDTLRWRVASDADYEATGGAIGCSLDLEPGHFGWAVELKREGRNEQFAAGAGFFVE